jgi:hypothetical protein
MCGKLKLNLRVSLAQRPTRIFFRKLQTKMNQSLFSFLKTGIQP